MKKILRVISVTALSICLIISFCACGAPSPTETADTFLSAVKAQDHETVKSVYAGKTFDILDSMGEDDAEVEESESIDSSFEKELKDKMLDFDYTLSNEKINDDKATVNVEVTTYALGKAMTSTMVKYIEEALPLAFSGASEEELEKMMNDIFEEELGALTDKTYTAKATINLVQQDGKWKVSEIDDEGELMNALSGDLVNAIKEINDSFDAWE
ncbi:MAG: hypothetical protein ACI4KL_02055 [Lentihominibacter sp.]